MKRLTFILTCFLLLVAIAGCAATKEEAAVETAVAIPFDRSVKPASGANPTLMLPEISNFELSNGLAVKLVKHSELPIVNVRILIHTGSFSDPKGQAGTASLTASMMDEGTTTKDAFQIADAKDFIGARLGTGSGWDDSYLTLSTLKKHLVPALELFSDIALNPTFPDEDFEKLRERTLTGILQQKDQARSLASKAFNRLVFGAEHPFGTPSGGTESSVKSISRDDLLAFYSANYMPNNATVVVVGDVTVEEITPLLEQYFGSWEAGDIADAASYPIEPLTDRKIYLVDKKEAAQSYIYIGHKGITRDDPDYITATVLNTILGGQFSSRVNLNLREDKGYTYGARTGFATRKAGGFFYASAGVETAVTDSSIYEFMYELRRIIDGMVTEEELAFAKSSIIQGMPAGFETSGQIAGVLGTLISNNLPDDYYSTYTQLIEAVTREEILVVAQKLITPDNMVVVIAGDVEAIQEGLTALDDGEVVVFTEDMMPE